MTTGDIILMATLRVLSKPDFDRSGIPDVENLIDKLEQHRAKLGIRPGFDETWLDEHRRKS